MELEFNFKNPLNLYIIKRIKNLVKIYIYIKFRIHLSNKFSFL